MPHSEKTIFRLAEAECGKRVSNVHIRPLDAAVIRDWRHQWDEDLKLPTNFEWDGIAEDIQGEQRNPYKYWGWAFYADEKLCGLASGYIQPPYFKQSALTIEYLEGNPHPKHPMKKQVLPCILAAAEVVGNQALNQFVRVLSPAKPTYKLYPHLGYRFYYHSSLGDLFEKPIF